LPTSPESFAESLKKLAAKFDADKPYHVSKEYSEAQARVDFITPFFKAQGWDVENEARLPHHQREVIVEKGESDMTGRPDYSFRIAGQTRFFVEAKAPSEPLDTTKHVLQAKGYPARRDMRRADYELWGRSNHTSPGTIASNKCLGPHKLQTSFGWAGFGVILRASQGWP